MLQYCFNFDKVLISLLIVSCLLFNVIKFLNKLFLEHQLNFEVKSKIFPYSFQNTL